MPSAVMGGSTFPSVTANKFVGSGSTPSVAAGDATIAGTGATVGVVGTDAGGEITLNTGTGISDIGTVLTLTFTSAYANAPAAVLSPSNALTGNTPGASKGLFSETTTTTLLIKVGEDSLNESATYKWHYVVMGR